jgi:hypothetical protein
MKKENKLQIRNSTAEFLIFTRQAGEKSEMPDRVRHDNIQRKWG